MGDFGISAEGRFAMMINERHTALSGGYAGSGTGGAANAPANLVANSFAMAINDTYFAPVGEWRVDASLKINRCIGLRAGYSGMAIGGIGRAASSVVYTLPSFGLSSSAGTDAIVVHAFTLGLEFNR